MSDLDLVGLRNTAEAATQDAWKFADEGSTVTVGTGSYVKSPGAYSTVDLIAEADVDYLEDEDLDTVEANYEHIAAFDPPTCLALLDRIEELERKRSKYRARFRGFVERREAQERELERRIEELEDELAEFREREAASVLEFDAVTRVEVIETGQRGYVKRFSEPGATLFLQDDSRTLKVFIDSDGDGDDH